MLSYHSAFFRFSQKTLTAEAVAYRPVAAGEEMTLSYVPLNLLSHHRAGLLAAWGFNCTCALCAGPSSARVQSDRQRTRIQTVLELIELPRYRNRASLAQLAAETLALCAREGMTAQTGDFHAIVARAYRGVGEPALAREHGLRAVELLRHYAGFDDERTMRAERMLEELAAEGK
jgi:hypothetical protein